MPSLPFFIGLYNLAEHEAGHLAHSHCFLCLYFLFLMPWSTGSLTATNPTTLIHKKQNIRYESQLWNGKFSCCTIWQTWCHWSKSSKLCFLAIQRGQDHTASPVFRFGISANEQTLMYWSMSEMIEGLEHLAYERTRRRESTAVCNYLMGK